MTGAPATDAVIAWVDGADPKHAARRADHQSGLAKAQTSAAAPTRFDSQGEIYVCIASILKFMPFIRYIWIVTDAQSPPLLNWFSQTGLCPPDRLRIVDHTDILSDHPQVLPTFNSRTIEAAIWRIPGLAERFIYFNDDMFAMRPLTRSYFFEDTRPVIRGTIRPIRQGKGAERLKMAVRRLLRPSAANRPSFHVAEELGALLAGARKEFIYAEHWPRPLQISTFKRFYTRHPTIFADQISHRFRHRAQHRPSALANNLEKTRLHPPPKVAYLKPGRREDAAIKSLVHSDADFGCMQSLDNIAKDKTAALFDGLVQKLDPYLRRDMLP